MLENCRYKFYLSFENSLCQEYITEKLFHNMQRFTVPVALVAANYLSILPPKSHIDIRDFESPRALAEYLKMLDKNDKVYNEYHAWRDKWEVEREGFNYCALCEVLHRTRGETKTHPDVMIWWMNGCVLPKHFYSGHAPLHVIK